MYKLLILLCATAMTASAASASGFYGKHTRYDAPTPRFGALRLNGRLPVGLYTAPFFSPSGASTRMALAPTAEAQVLVAPFIGLGARAGLIHTGASSVSDLDDRLGFRYTGVHLDMTAAVDLYLVRVYGLHSVLAAGTLKPARGSAGESTPGTEKHIGFGVDFHPLPFPDEYYRDVYHKPGPFLHNWSITGEFRHMVVFQREASDDTPSRVAGNLLLISVGL